MVLLFVLVCVTALLTVSCFAADLCSQKLLICQACKSDVLLLFMPVVLGIGGEYGKRC